MKRSHIDRRFRLPNRGVEMLEPRCLLSAAVLSQIPTQSITAGQSQTPIALSTFFNDPTITGTAVDIQSSMGSIPIVLTDTATPQTVANFLHYVSSGEYANTIFHRTVPGFVLQGGGYTIDGPHISTFGTIPGESTDPGALSNTTGTIAMALTTTMQDPMPNSATSEWYINLDNNDGTTGVENLDNTSDGGPFTVFGSVIYNGMTVVNAIANLGQVDDSVANGAWNTLPVNSNYTGPTGTGTSNPVAATPVPAADLVTINPVVVPGGLNYTVTSSNPGLVTGAISNGSLTLTPVNGSGAANITVTATDLGGGTATSTFAVNVTSNFVPPPAAHIGNLDPTFGVNGLVAHNVNLTSTAGLVVEADPGSIIAGTAGNAGNQVIAITRYNVDGSLDTSFGTDGVTETPLPGNAQAAAEALLPDGDILVAGTVATLVNGQPTGSQFALVEYTSDGVPDATFGNGAGYELTSFSSTAGTLSNDVAHAMVVGSDGTIYVGGSSDANGHGLDFAIAAYTPSGSPSPGFGTNGRVLLDFTGGDDSIGALALEPKGGLIAAGSAINPSSGVSSVAVAGFLSSGALNPKFGVKGKLTTSVGGVDDAASALAIDPKGNIVVGGYTGTGSASAGTLSANFLLLRYAPTGKLDKTFGSGGIVTTSFNQPAAISSVLIDADGTIVASGKTVASLATLNVSELNLAAARYTSKGQLDTSFNATGNVPGTAIYNISNAVTTASLTASPTADGAEVQPALVQSTVAIPFDATSDLMAAFMQLTQSDQGVIATTSGGELLDVGNSDGNTVEAAIVAMGLDLAATLSASLPPSIIGGGKGMAAINIVEIGTELASGTYAIELFASSTSNPANGQMPFQTFSEKLKLKEGMAKSLKLKFQYPSSLSKGNYYLVATVETGSVRDLDPANNVAASASTVLIAPPFVQLTAAALTAPAFDGDKPATVSITVTNAGNETASVASAVQFFASTTGTPTGAFSIATTPLKLNLKAGAAHAYKLKFALPATLSAGTYMLVALLDPANVFDDPNAAVNFIVSGNTFVVA